MNEVKNYWRDKVTQLLLWGTTVLVVVSGWSIKDSERFELGGHLPEELMTWVIKSGLSYYCYSAFYLEFYGTNRVSGFILNT